MERHSTWIAAVLIVLLLLGGYVVTYLACSDRLRERYRVFPNDTLATGFTPLARIESLLQGHEVKAETLDGMLYDVLSSIELPPTQDKNSTQ